VSVVVLDANKIAKVDINKRDIERKTTRGSGAGGQHRNKVETVVVLKHLPTGIIVRAEQGRSQAQNEEFAYRELQRKLYTTMQQQQQSAVERQRDSQIVKNGRSDKRRTYRVRDQVVIDYITNKKAKLKNILRGQLELLH